VGDRGGTRFLGRPCQTRPPRRDPGAGPPPEPAPLTLHSFLAEPLRVGDADTHGPLAVFPVFAPAVLDAIEAADVPAPTTEESRAFVASLARTRVTQHDGLASAATRVSRTAA
jgi:hypothetical protein